MNRQWDDGPMLPHKARSLMDRFDPRLRTLAVVLFAVAAMAAARWTSLLGLLIFSVICLALASISMRTVIRQCLPIFGFGVVLFLILPWTVPGPPLGTGFLAQASWEGVAQAGSIVLRAAIVVIAALGLIGTLEIPVLGHVLAHLRLPTKFVSVFLFTVRYLQVLNDEYHRLRTAMVARGFRPGVNWHTYRTYGYLVGMLLVRSLARSERILEAMRCRGFQGRFYLLDHFHFSGWDLLFGFACLMAAGLYLRWEIAL
ncbi:MAG: cobalt ECF transporter T component CbiQ [Thermogutta sp.]